jgi:hypothetical protein
MDAAPLAAAFRTLLNAAATVAEFGDSTAPPPGEWNADQILTGLPQLVGTFGLDR